MDPRRAGPPGSCPEATATHATLADRTTTCASPHPYRGRCRWRRPGAACSCRTPGAGIALRCACQRENVSRWSTVGRPGGSPFKYAKRVRACVPVVRATSCHALCTGLWRRQSRLPGEARAAGYASRACCDLLRAVCCLCAMLPLSRGPRLHVRAVCPHLRAVSGEWRRRTGLSAAMLRSQALQPLLRHLCVEEE
jgi:hypothetical protein